MNTSRFFSTLAQSTLAVILLASAACKIGTTTEDGGEAVSTLSAADLRLSDEVSGWSDKPAAYLECDPDCFRASILDGGVNIYADRGLVEGVYQEMEGPNGRNLGVYVFDHASIEAATGMFDYLAQNEISRPLSIGSYDRAVVIATQDLGASITVYAHFNKFVFKMTLNGYQEQTTAVNDAAGFLATYQQKLQ